jgi:hypothetical protein
MIPQESRPMRRKMQKSRQLSVDLVEEERDLAAQRSAIYQ